MIQPAIHYNQVFCDVLTLVDEFLVAKKKCQFLRSWTTLKNYGLLKNAKLLNKNIEISRTIPLNGLSDHGDSTVINVPLCDSKHVSKQSSPLNQQKKEILQNTEFQDKIIQKLFYLENLVEQMKQNLQKKQFELDYLKQKIEDNSFKVNNLNSTLPNQSDILYQSHSPSNQQYSYYDNVLRSSMNSSAINNKTQILGKMFDEQNQSVKNMIFAIRQRNSSIIQDKKRKRCQSSINCQTQFQIYRNSMNSSMSQKFNELDGYDILLQSQVQTQQNLFYRKDFCKNKKISPINSQINSLSRERSYNKKVQNQCPNTKIYKNQEKNNSFENLKNNESRNLTPKLNFRRKQCGQLETQKLSNLKIQQHPKTQRFVRNRISAIN